MIGTALPSVAQRVNGRRQVGVASLLDEAPGILRTPGARPLLGDAFNRFEVDVDSALHVSPVADLGGQWTKIAGDGLGHTDNQGMPAGVVTPIDAVSPNDRSTGRASGFYALASGAKLVDVTADLAVSYGGTAPTVVAASPAIVDVWPKARNASVGVWARFVPGPSHTLQIQSDDGSGATTHASAGIASTLASGLYAGQSHRLVVQVLGNQMNVWLGTGVLNPTPALSATSPRFQIVGHPQLKVLAPTSSFLNSVLQLETFAINEAGATAIDIGPREWFRFESHPERRAIQSNASVFKADHAANFRGEHPRIPPCGSGGPSGPAQMIVIAGEVDDFLGNDLLDVRVDALEQFSMLR